jgi:hypothetical protein
MKFVINKRKKFISFLNMEYDVNTSANSYAYNLEILSHELTNIKFKNIIANNKIPNDCLKIIVDYMN